MLRTEKRPVSRDETVDVLECDLCKVEHVMRRGSGERMDAVLQWLTLRPLDMDSQGASRHYCEGCGQAVLERIDKLIAPKFTDTPKVG